jgi:hypothetical protein
MFEIREDEKRRGINLRCWDYRKQRMHGSIRQPNKSTRDQYRPSIWSAST